MPLSIHWASSIALALLLSPPQTHAQDVDPLANTPDYSQDPYPPYPPLTNEDGSNITIENLRGTRLYGWTACDRDERKAIAGAFDDFYKLANPLSSTINWADEVSEDFWGKNEGTNKVPDDRRTQIQQIFKAQQQMYAVGWHVFPPYWTSLWIEVRCSGGDETGDPNNVCKDKTPDDGNCGRTGQPPTGSNQDDRLEAYSDSPSRDTSLKYSRITFCTKFFNLPTLGEAITNTQKKPAATKDLLQSWNNRARVFLHETTHLDYFMNAPGTSPRIDDLQFDWRDAAGRVVRDEVYGPYFCKMLRNYGQAEQVGFYPQRNADSYAWFALGAYIQQVTGTYPRKPRPRTFPVDDPYNSGGGDVRVLDAATANADAADFAGQPDEDLIADGTDEPDVKVTEYEPPGCPDVLPIVGTTSSDPPPQEPADPPPADNNACHGISGDYWVMDRNVAATNVEDFCAQTEDTKTYNDGSVNELSLSVKNGDAPASPTDAPDCVARFTGSILDGCDGNDPVNNPHNYKFGATLTTADGWQYKMEPLSQQVHEVNCDVSYKFWYDQFEIRGKNWPGALIGTDGAGLKSELDGCGEVTEWHFETTPTDCCFEWYAAGHLPIGTKNCVGDAVVTAGGSGEGNCHGAGRKRKEHAAIDNWPGYGDESRHIFRDEVADKW